MSLIKHGRVINPEIVRMVRLNTSMPSIELWFGDAATMASYPANEPVSHFIATSNDPSSLLVGSASINSGLTGALGKLPPGGTVDFRPPLDGAVFPTGAAFAGVFDQALWYDPKFEALTPAQAAPYQTDDIFRAIQAFSGHISCSVTIPVTVDPSDLAPSLIMLRSLVHSALKYSAWNDCRLTQVRIVMDTKDTAFTSAFDELAEIHDQLQNAAASPAIPMPANPDNGVPWVSYVTEGNGWIAKEYPKGHFPDPVSQRQVFGIYIYTSEYFHALQDNLRQTDSKLPVTKDGVGFTDLSNPDYYRQIPLYAAISSGLMNIPAFHGTTYRGGNTSWNPFKPGGTVRYLSYVSSASEYEDPRLNPWNHPTPPPWNNSSHLRLQSQSARNIAPYSKHHYELEHLFDYGLILYVSAHTTLSSGETVIAANEVPPTVLPLLK